MILNGYVIKDKFYNVLRSINLYMPIQINKVYVLYTDIKERIELGSVDDREVINKIEKTYSENPDVVFLMSKRFDITLGDMGGTEKDIDDCPLFILFDDADFIEFVFRDDKSLNIIHPVENAGCFFTDSIFFEAWKKILKNQN